VSSAAPNRTTSHGASAHDSGCTCTRCQGFTSANTAALTHGSYASPATLAPEAERWATWLRETAPLYSAADEPTVALAATTLVRAERAAAALAEVDRATEGREIAAYVGKGEALDRLRQDLRGWIGLATRLLDKLGCSPTSRAALGVDVARGRALARAPLVGDLDLDRLTPQEMLQLERLAERAGGRDA
jgi:hypothetical protein